MARPLAESIHEPVIPRRGRPRIGEEAARREAVLDAAFALMVERGYGATTMLDVARRAGASKETLYSWFGSKQGLFGALVRRQADLTNERIATALGGSDHRLVLAEFATNLLALLLSERSLALNRAAMSTPELAEVLLAHGRRTTGPLVEAYLARLSTEGILEIASPAEAFQLLYGLVIQDHQIRALLGEASLSARDTANHARRAVDNFLRLTARSNQPG